MISQRISIPFSARLSLLLLWVMSAANSVGTCQGRPNHPPTRSSYGSGPASHQLVSSGRACRFYVWDASSAILYAWCQHLQRDCTFEGRGGHRFVQVRPRSVLRILYPCSRYSPDRCIVCGGCYKDHLILGWTKHLHKPLDRLMDKMYDDSLVSLDPESRTNSKAAKNRSKSVVHAFHRRYVLDTSQSIVKKNGRRLSLKERARKIYPQFVERYGSIDRRLLSVGLWNNGLFVPERSPEGKRPSLLIGIFRRMLVDSVNDLYRLQMQDNLMRHSGKSE